MTKRVATGFAFIVFALGTFSGVAVSQAAHVQWVADSLIRMRTITPGMTRAELLEVFQTEGGMSTATMRTFVSKDCPYFKVDVTFRGVGPSVPVDEGRSSIQIEDAQDVIVSISRPYLQFTILD